MKISPNYSEKAESKKAQGIKQTWRPQSTHKHETGSVCPHCGASVHPHAAICGSCGRSLTADKCSFCGSPMKSGAKFCTRCGQSREGVTCPECGTLNSRNFCRHCNSPLTPAAIKFKEEALNDPKFKAIKTRAQELATLHRKIEELAAETSSTLCEADRNLLDEYAALFSSIGAAKPEIKTAPAESSAPAEPDSTFNLMSVEEMMKAYREKAEEMNRALAELAPPPDYTPEQQRDYYAARKIASFETEVELIGYAPTMWKCNLCGCLHETPPECTRPDLGGTWVYVSPDDYLREHPELAITSVSLKIN